MGSEAAAETALNIAAAAMAAVTTLLVILVITISSSNDDKYYRDKYNLTDPGAPVNIFYRDIDFRNIVGMFTLLGPENEPREQRSTASS
jgi:hypothetical protein